MAEKRDDGAQPEGDDPDARRDPEFSEQYARAKDESAHAHSEHILEVVDRVLNEEVNPNP